MVNAGARLRRPQPLPRLRLIGHGCAHHLPPSAATPHMEAGAPHAFTKLTSAGSGHLRVSITCSEWLGQQSGQWSQQLSRLCPDLTPRWLWFDQFKFKVSSHSQDAGLCLPSGRT